MKADVGTVVLIEYKRLAGVCSGSKRQFNENWTWCFVTFHNTLLPDIVWLGSSCTSNFKAWFSRHLQRKMIVSLLLIVVREHFLFSLYYPASLQSADCCRLTLIVLPQSSLKLAFLFSFFFCFFFQLHWHLLPCVLPSTSISFWIRLDCSMMTGLLKVRISATWTWKIWCMFKLEKVRQVTLPSKIEHSFLHNSAAALLSGAAGGWQCLQWNHRTYSVHTCALPYLLYKYWIYTTQKKFWDSRTILQMLIDLKSDELHYKV